jgi:hypothetical protein
LFININEAGKNVNSLFGAGESPLTLTGGVRIFLGVTILKKVA